MEEKKTNKQIVMHPYKWIIDPIYYASDIMKRNSEFFLNQDHKIMLSTTNLEEVSYSQAWNIIS